MRVAIAGAGAIGCHYGAQLLRAGVEVRFLARGRQLAALQQHGLTQFSAGQQRHFTVTASGDPATLADSAIWLICCKTTALPDLCRQIAPHVAPDAVLITLQNGLTAGDIVAGEFPRHTVMVGSAFIGARIDRPGEVIHSAAGHLRIADWQGRGSDIIAPLLAHWQQAGTDAKLVDDGRLMLWRKMVWNCGFNAITAIVRRYARDIATDPELARIASAAMDELIAVAQAEGVALTEEDGRRNMAITRTMEPVKTSAWQDIERGRPTEIDDLNGEVVRRAERHNIEAPVNRTLTALIHGIGNQPPH